MKSVDPNKYQIPFGGITVLLDGDFHQILHVIIHASRGEIVSKCITASPLWRHCKIFLLRRNIRLNKSKTLEEGESLRQFVESVLKIEDDVLRPTILCDPEMENSIEKMIQCTYPDFLSNYKSTHYLGERAIFTTTNQIVGHLNSIIVDTLLDAKFHYFSVDRVEDFCRTASDSVFAFPPEYLNSMSVPGLPHHDLKLKVGVVVMLTRNLDQTLGLCNGTRMMVSKCLKHRVECEVICGAFVGTKHFISRMELCLIDSKLPFKLIQKKLPLQVCYSMTINKSQGESFKRVGLFLPNLIFTHGQLHVVVSRVTSTEGLKVFIDSVSGSATNVTQNIVYKKVFYNLPAV